MRIDTLAILNPYGNISQSFCFVSCLLFNAQMSKETISVHRKIECCVSTELQTICSFLRPMALK